MTGRKDPFARATGARLLFLAALLLALGATGVLVFSDSVRWMRLGVVAALWAALAGAFLAVRYRRISADRAEDAAQAREVYELELEREVAARREFELAAEAAARTQAEERARDDLAELRAELKAMRENLEMLLGGEVLVERIALHAESTRMRARSAESLESPAEARRAIPAAGEPKTDLIERVREPWLEDTPSSRPIDPNWTPSWESGEHRRARPARPTPTRPAEQAGRHPADQQRPAESRPARPEAARGGRPTQPAPRRETDQKVVAARLDGEPPARPRRPEAAGEAGEQRPAQARPQSEAGRRTGRPEAQSGAEQPAQRARPRPEAQAGPQDATATGLRPAARDAEATRQGVRPVDPATQHGVRPVAQDRSGPPRVVSRREPSLPSAADAVRGRRAVDSAVFPPVDGTGSEPERGKRAAASGVFPPAQPKRAAESGVFAPAQPKRPAESGAFPQSQAKRAAEPSAPQPERGKRAAESGVFPPAQPKRAEPAEPVRGKRAAETGVFPPAQPKRAESARPGSAAAAASAGRRAAAESGTFAPVEEPGGRRRKPEQAPEPQGTHASGTSVAELLAAHGGNSPRRRRRRDED